MPTTTEAKAYYQKLRGGYYTPEPIARFLAKWALRTSADSVLEPSCGDGNILEAAVKRLQALGATNDQLASQVRGVEFDPVEADKAVHRLHGHSVTRAAKIVSTSDFFSHARTHLFPETLLGVPTSSGQSFDAVLSNPPFIRYQNFPEAHREVAFQLMNERGFQPNRLTNAWLPFLILSTFLLKEDGRLAMVIPAELFQVNYAAEARKFLSDHFTNLTLITFKKLLFDGVQQEVILLLGERDGELSEGVRTVELNNAEDLEQFEPSQLSRVAVKPMNHSTEKWTQYFLDKDEILLLRELSKSSNVIRSGEVIDVDVGVVTGNNKYFILNEEKVAARELEPHVKRIVARSAHLEGADFTELDWQSNVEKQYPTSLFLPNVEVSKDLPSSVLAYVEEGERDEQHTGYKCRIRKRWYVVPSVWVPDAFMLRQVHSYPKLILNSARATCTDTIHRVRFINGYPGPVVAAAFLNSLTFAYAEVKGRSYGGGVLTFEPSEAESLPLPLKNAEKLDLDHIDFLLREDDINSVLDLTDHVLLEEGLDLPRQKVKALRTMWTKLRDRRVNRR